MSQPTHSNATLTENFGALTERVTGAERQIASLHEQLTGFQRDTTAQFNSLASTVSQQIGGLADKLDRQTTTFATSRQTNWPALISAAAAVVAVIMTLFFAFLSPVSASIGAATNDLKEIARGTVPKDEFAQYRAETNLWLGSLRDRLRSDEDVAVSQRQVKELTERMDDRDRIRAEGFQATDTRLQQQIDELRREYTSVLSRTISPGTQH